MLEKNLGNALLCVLALGVFSGCSTTPPRSTASPPPKPLAKTINTPDPVPAWEPPSRTGNPSSYVVFGRRYYVSPSSEGYRQQGTASWYGDDFHGKKTSSGVPFDMYSVSAAHKNLPIPSYARVTHLGTGRSIVVKVNDRGPFVDERIIDLSYAAAAKLGMVEEGVAPVEVEALPPYQYLDGFGPGQPYQLAGASGKPRATGSAAEQIPAARLAANSPATDVQRLPARTAVTPSAAPAPPASPVFMAVAAPPTAGKSPEATFRVPVAATLSGRNTPARSAAPTATVEPPVEAIPQRALAAARPVKPTPASAVRPARVELAEVARKTSTTTTVRPVKSVPGSASARPAKAEPVAVSDRSLAAGSAAAARLLPAPLTTSLYLQVGAFSERQNAERLQKQLSKQLDHGVRIESESGRLHKVRVGPFSNPGEAKRLQLALAQRGIDAHPVVFGKP